MTSPRSTRRIAFLAIATLTTVLLIPATPASAADVEVDLGPRCLTQFTGVYPDDGTLEVPADATSIFIRYPDAASDNIDEGLESRSVVTLRGPDGTATTPAYTSEGASGVRIQVPEGALAGATPDASTVMIEIRGWVHRINPCPAAADLGGVSTRLDLLVTARIVAPAGEGAVLDLRQTIEGTEDAGIIDTASGEPPAVQWGDTVTLRARPGYFNGELEGLGWPPPLTASIGQPSPFFGEVDLAVPVVSADGSTATVTLPDANPEPDPEFWYLYRDAQIWIRGISATGSGTTAHAVVVTPTPDEVAVTGTTPALSRSPKLLRPVRADAGAWGPAGVTLSYQWLLNGKPIAGATKATYTPKIKDYGKALSVRVTGTFAASDPVTLTSSAQKVRLF